MRTRNSRLSAAIILFLFTSVAAATVRPPIQVRLADEQIVVEEGRSFSNVLEIRAGFPLSIGDITLQGADWSVALELQKATLSAKAGDVIRIPFTATPSSDSAPLQLDFSYEGGQFSRQLDISPAAYRRSKVPNSTQVVSEPDAIHSAADLARPGAAPTELQVEVSPQGGGKVGRWVRVHGRFGFYLPVPAGQFRGTDGAGVYVMDQRFPSDALLVSGVTDAQGYFDLSFWWDPCAVFCDTSLDIYVKFEAANSEIVVRNFFPAGTYAWNTGAWVAYTGADLDIGTHVPGNPADYGAPHFLTSATRTWRWFANRGYDPIGVTGYWPAGSTFYQPAFWPLGPEIHLSADRQWEDSVISHEWGHHWVVSYASSPSPAYCNAMCDDGGCTHCIWCAENANVAFTEGAPDWMGDVIPRGYPAQYGGSISGPAYNFEPLDTCQMDGTYHDPINTEGFFASLLRDMEDATQDNHWQYALGDDQMVNATAAILYVIDAAHPTDPMAFLNTYKAFYPAECEALWATAKNCGYEIDLGLPGVAGGLWSPSHFISLGNVDPTVDLAWSRAPDDCAGTSGYSIVVAASASFPDATAEIGNVTSYTTGSLAPGTYYFSMRAVDASGKWSASYASYGPFIILTPPPIAPNLAFAPGDAFWAHAMVPRPAPDASIFSAPNPSLLDGDACGIYWNARFGNYGTASFLQPSSIYFSVDQWPVQQVEFYDPSPFYGYVLNLGPDCATGGRHTLSTILDPYNDVSELNEYDNWWGHQWVFDPTPLTANVETTRSAPPEKWAGIGSIVDGSPIYQNTDGVRMYGASWWSAVVLHSDDPGTDYDLSLFSSTVNADSGFDVPQASSDRVAGYTDAVIVNNNYFGWGMSFDAGVLNFSGSGSNYAIEHVTEQYLPFNAVTNGNLAAGQSLRLWEIWLDPGSYGQYVTLRVRKTSGPGLAPLNFSFLSNGWTLGSPMGGYVGSTDPGSGFGYMELDLTTINGYCAVVIQRDPGAATIAETIEVSIVPSPPDFQPGWEAMWWSPLVPRAANDGTPSTVFAPTTLPGDQWSTYFNINSGNWGYGSAPSMRSDIDLDGIWGWYVSYFGFPAFANWPFNWNAAWYVPSGRHALILRTDGPNEHLENIEWNNHWGEQWIWEPQMLAYNTPVLRGLPPDPIGGWGQLTSGEPLHYNVDAVRSPYAQIAGNDGYWTIVATMPAASDDVDLWLHDEATSAKNGLNTYLANSFWGTGQSDFVARNYNLGGPNRYDVGVQRFYSTERYKVESDRSVHLPANPGFAYGPFEMEAGEIVDIYEVYFAPGDQQLALYPISGAINYGLSIYPADTPTFGKSYVLPGGLSDMNGVGEWEQVTVNIPVPGYYGVVVWKSGSSDLEQAGEYRLAMLAGATDVADEATPVRTQIASVQPNPFNPRTTIQFDVAKAGAVSLQIFDLRGRVLRTLLAEPMPAGRHERIWDGIDDRGHTVASGVYIVQLSSAGTVERQKIVLLK